MRNLNHSRLDNSKVPPITCWKIGKIGTHTISKNADRKIVCVPLYLRPELVGRGRMSDPLTNFDWSSLYRKYDARCIGFDKNSTFLATLGADLPNSDRMLYYRLRDLFSIKQRVALTDPISTYEALLYWKLYSQSTATYNLPKWLREDASKRIRAQENLLQLFRELPTTVDRSPSAVVELGGVWDFV